MTDEKKFALQLQQLAVMGFSDHAANLEGMFIEMYQERACSQNYSGAPEKKLVYFM